MPIAARGFVVAVFLLSLAGSVARAQPYSRATLPQDHEYQKVLYKFMATITEAAMRDERTGAGTEASAHG